MAQVGADLATLASLSKEFGTDAGEVHTLVGRLDGAVNNAVWTGKRADDFRKEWTDFKKVLVKLQTALEDGKKDIDAHHKNIDAALNGAK